MNHRITLLLMLCIFSGSIMAQQVLKLYDGLPPGNKPGPSKEKSVTTNGVARISKITEPTLTVYKAAEPSSKRAAVIICPGGGYSIVAITHEGLDVARLFQSWGITAFVLKYRLPDDTTMADKANAPLQDAQRAIQLVRERAAEFNIDPGKIGIMGFSAGGHVASTASTHFLSAVIANPNNISLRPDFSILIYPVVSFTDSLAHLGSRNNLIGRSPTTEKINWYSNELQVNATTPPAFLVHAGDDRTVKVTNSIRYYEALLKNKVIAEMHIYQAGGHGFGLHNSTTNDEWSGRLKNWLIANQWL